jgi:hypothetical protein
MGFFFLQEIAEGNNFYCMEGLFQEATRQK